jgi:hypothetical protein
MEIAKKTNIPIVLLTQLNRSIEKADRTPNLADIRGSGTIEQDAYTVLFVRPEKEPISQYDKSVVRCNVFIAKNRGGEITTNDRPISFIWNKATGQYYNFGQTPTPQVLYINKQKQNKITHTTDETIEQLTLRLQREQNITQQQQSYSIVFDNPDNIYLHNQTQNQNNETPF